MLSEGKVGTRALARGAVSEVRINNTGALCVADTHGRYQEAVLGGNVFTASTQAAVTFGVGLSATLATFGLYNPAGSGKNLVVLSTQLAFSAAPAGATVLYYVANINPVAAAPTGTTLLVVRNSLLGVGTSAIGQALTAATLPAAPVALRVLTSILGAASITAPFIDDELSGQIIVGPGCVLSIQATAAASAFISMTWEELSIFP